VPVVLLELRPAGPQVLGSATRKRRQVSETLIDAENSLPATAVSFGPIDASRFDMGLCPGLCSR